MFYCSFFGLGTSLFKLSFGFVFMQVPASKSCVCQELGHHMFMIEKARSKAHNTDTKSKEQNHETVPFMFFKFQIS